MRFLNWDVLLFPDESRIPVQEFDVKCHALAIQSDNLLPRNINASAAYNASLTQVPNLTGFIPSLDPGHTFRVSVHSWEKPKPSDLLLSFKPAPERIIFEAKLFVDGNLKAQRYLGEQSGWPEVIDTTGGPTTSAEFSKQLRFPPFDAQVLQQSHWDASDDLGRIRIVIAEGVSRGSGQGKAFDKLRDVVAFSFQHAPRQILEHSGIAWPNARMFERSSTPVQPLPATRTPGFDAHAHSPQRPSTSAGLQASKHATQRPMSLGMQSAGTWSKKKSSNDDPFVSPPHAQPFTLHDRAKTKTDVSMPDASSSKSYSEMSGVAIQQPDFSQQLNQAAVDEILRAMSPDKRQALLIAMGPGRQPVPAPIAGQQNAMRPMTNNRVESMKAFEPNMRPRSANAIRKSSSESRRSTSGQSTTMSWDETPTLGELWSSNSNEFPGLLPSIHGFDQRTRSNSLGSKRKRSMSPVVLNPTVGDTITAVKGMSTSPCKAASTPAQKNRAAGDDDAETPVRAQHNTIRIGS